MKVCEMDLNGVHVEIYDDSIESDKEREKILERVAGRVSAALEGREQKKITTEAPPT